MIYSAKIDFSVGCAVVEHPNPPMGKPVSEKSPETLPEMLCFHQVSHTDYFLVV